MNPLKQPRVRARTRDNDELHLKAITGEQRVAHQGRKHWQCCLGDKGLAHFRPLDDLCLDRQTSPKCLQHGVGVKPILCSQVVQKVGASTGSSWGASSCALGGVFWATKLSNVFCVLAGFFVTVAWGNSAPHS